MNLIKQLLDGCQRDMGMFIERIKAFDETEWNAFIESANTGFFSEVAAIADGVPLAFSFMATGGKLTVGMLPTSLKGVKMLNITGLPHELDSNFFTTIKEPAEAMKVATANVKEFTESLKNAEPAKKAAAAAKPKEKDADDDDDDSEKEDTGKKKVEKPKPAASPKKEEPQQPQQMTIE